MHKKVDLQNKKALVEAYLYYNLIARLFYMFEKTQLKILSLLTSFISQITLKGKINYSILSWRDSNSQCYALILQISGHTNRPSTHCVTKIRT